MEYLSKQKYDEIAAELKHLINEVYPKVQDELAEASARETGATTPAIVKQGGSRGKPSAGSVSCRRSWNIHA